ncbi:MAG: PilZ domain-containing protein [Gammaproteobacteria bacterium]|jgi:hypothetical protein
MSLLTLTGFRRSRCTLAAQARVRSVHGECLAGVVDLSLTGANLRRPSGFDPPVGHPVEVELRCGPDGGRRLAIRGRVVRREPEALALRFELVSPMIERELQAILDAYGTLRDDTEEP